MSGQRVPGWALQRVDSVLEAERRAGRQTTDLASLARMAGVSKRLVRRCLAVRTAQG